MSLPLGISSISSWIPKRSNVVLKVSPRFKSSILLILEKRTGKKKKERRNIRWHCQKHVSGNFMQNE